MQVRELSFLAAAAVLAAPPAARAERIRDNLFLLEEAYNQEPGVIQHISVFRYAPADGAWQYSFTEEWPVPTDRHQLSVTLNLGAAGRDGAAGLEDLLLNYRVQALGAGGEGWIALAPRLSLVLPAGNPEQGTGRGGVGVQANLPLSLELGPSFVVHLNAGATLTPAARSPGGRSDVAVDANAGLAVVWQPLAWLNPLIEISYTSTAEVGDLGSARVDALVVDPGVRMAIDFPRSGLQVVPGIAAPVQLLPRRAVGAAVLAYLSFEHPAF